MILKFIGKIYDMYRRKFYRAFRKDYIEASLLKRKGKCNKCGCCSVNLPACIHFDYSKNECRLWREGGKKNMPINCQAYPFDERDKTEFSKKYCGYYWEEE